MRLQNWVSPVSRRPKSLITATLVSPRTGAKTQKAGSEYPSRPLSCGRGEKIRTSDPLHPMQVRYQAALRPDRALHYSRGIAARPRRNACGWIKGSQAAPREKRMDAKAAATATNAAI